MLAEECYQVVLVAKENHTWMIEKKKEEKVKALETVALVDGESKKTTRIRTTLSDQMKRRLVQFLKGNLDVFV